MEPDPKARSAAILTYWFGPIDDQTHLDRQAEPFATYFRRWYGKDPQTDAAIRSAFEGDLHAVIHDGRGWDATVRAWSEQPEGLLALTILLDQVPRNSYRDTKGMYTWDTLAVLVSEQARANGAEHLPLAHQMFLSVPLMHVENLTMQERMLVDFERFAELARTRSPHNLGFWRFALDYAARHVEVIRRFGRFPHRNAILGRVSTDEEAQFLSTGNANF